MNNAYSIPINSLTGEKDFLSAFNGKLTLMVNIATKCGYKPKCSPLWSYARTSRQLWQLQQIHDQFKHSGFSVIGFPCNQFGKMEPCSNKEIFNFIKINYSFITFPISEKIEVNGTNEHKLYSFLKGKEKRRYSDNKADSSFAAARGQNIAGQAMNRIPHNYEKFLVGADGNVIMRFNWRDMPLDEEPVDMGSNFTIKELIKEVLY